MKYSACVKETRMLVLVDTFFFFWSRRIVNYFDNIELNGKSTRPKHDCKQSLKLLYLIKKKGR